jgi:DNA repair ATPase RecN
MYEWIAIITAVALIITAISTAITAKIEKRVSRKQLIVEVLNDVIIPLLNEIERYESKCQYYIDQVGILTTRIDVENYARSDILHRRFTALLKKYHYYKEFQREVNEFNNVQQTLQRKVDVLKSTLANILQEDKRIQVLWEEKVGKEYSHLDFTKAKDTIIKDFISSWCSISSQGSEQPVGVWHILGKDLWVEYYEKVRNILNEISELIERRKQIAQKLKEMLKRVLDKAVEDYNVLDSELRRERFEIV